MTAMAQAVGLPEDRGLRVLILGGTGMLGHRLWIELSPAHEAWVSVRGRAEDLSGLPGVDLGHVCSGVDVTDADALTQLFRTVRPEVVVNCVGLVKQHSLGSNPEAAITLNALLPHQLLRRCEAAGARLIHVSTDCVFSGSRGGYSEQDAPDPTDLYGQTKLLGEVPEPALTIRTSMVGPELRSRYGILEWFLAQSGTVRGYTRARFSGLTTAALARLLREHVLPRPDLRGLYHVSAQPIDKFDLLNLFKEYYRLDTHIDPDDRVVIDRTLDSTRFREATGFRPASWPDMIREMADEHRPYARLAV